MLGQQTRCAWVIQPKDKSNGFKYLCFRDTIPTHVDDILEAELFSSYEEALEILKEIKDREYQITAIFIKTTYALHRAQKKNED